ncbi:MAG TPA: hypothetical protein ENK46_03415 [Flavobacteriia bacterium]|nr:hypothetical protein [Flavobacteriia bacterium]
MKTLGIISLSLLLLIGCKQAKSQSTILKNEKIRKSTEAVPLQQTDTVFTFDNDDLGKIPAGWSQYFTGRGKSTDWKIVDDNQNKVLAQVSSQPIGYHFNEIVYDGFKVKNVALKVRLKGVKGKKDQGGGFVWRFIDADNYYIVRANPLEDNVVLYKMKDGKRTDLPLLGKGRTYGVDVKPLGNDWNELQLTVIDDLFTVYLNGIELFQVTDKTFTGAGKVGLWTKADAVSYFDDFEVKNLGK